MCTDIFQKGIADHSGGHHDVLADFILLGRYLVFHLSEFAQKSQQTVKLNEKKEGRGGSPRAFVFDDIDLVASKNP